MSALPYRVLNTKDNLVFHMDSEDKVCTLWKSKMILKYFKIYMLSLEGLALIPVKLACPDGGHLHV